MEEDNIYEYEGKSYSESALREAYPNTFDEYVNQGILTKVGGEEPVDVSDTQEESFYEYEGVSYAESALREAYPDTFDEYVNQGILTKVDGLGKQIAVEDSAAARDMDLVSEDGLSESQEEDTWLERTFGKNEFTDFFGDIYRAGKQGFLQAESVDPSIDIMTAGEDASVQDLYNYVQTQKRIQRGSAESDEMKDFNRVFEESGGGAMGFLMGILESPTVLPSLFVSSMATQIGSLASEEVVASAAAGAGTGAVAGSAIPLIGTATGALGGGFAGLATAMEAGLTFSELLQEEIEGEITIDKVQKILQDPEKLSELRRKAIGRGAAIGAVEALSAGLAGKATKAVAGAVSKGKSVAGRAVRKVAAPLAGGAVEVVGGSTGEVAGRLAAGQEMDVKEIGFEGFAGLGSAPLTVLPAAIKNINIVSGRVDATKKAKEGGYENVASVFKPDTKIDETTIELSSKKNTSNIVDEQVEIEVANGRMTEEEADAIKLNFRDTQGAVNTANKIDRLTPENKIEAVELLIEEGRLKEKIKDVDNAALTKTESERLKKVQARLEEISNPKEEVVSEKTPSTEEEAGVPPTPKKPVSVETATAEEVIPQEALEELEKEIQSRESQGNLLDNANKEEKVYLNGKEGNVRIDPTNENTIIFESSDEIIELGNKDEVGSEPIAGFGLTTMPPEGLDVQAETMDADVVSIDGKEYNVIGRSKDKKGKAVVKVKEVIRGTDKETGEPIIKSGLVRRIKGAKAERVLKDVQLRKERKETPLPLTTEGKEVTAPTKKERRAKRVAERKKAREEYDKKSLEELSQMEEESQKSIQEFEEMALEEAAQESKNKDLVQVGENIFQVTKNDDGSFSVSQMNESGRLIGTREESKRRKAIGVFKSKKSNQEKMALAKAEKLIDDFKKEELQRIDDAINERLSARQQKAEGSKPAFNERIAAPESVVTSALKVLRNSYASGMTIMQSIDDALSFIEEQGFSANEFYFKKFVLDTLRTPKPKETTKAAPKTKAAPTETTKATGRERIIDKYGKARIRRQVEKARKALSKIAKGVTIEVYETEQEFMQSTNGDNSPGIYVIPTKTIKINLEKANPRTVAHEVFHALLLKDGIADAKAQKVTSDMMAAVRKVASPELLKQLDAFASQYKNELQSEESIAQLFGILAENYESSPKSVKDLINEWLRKLAKILNVPVEGILDSDKQVLEFLDVVSGKVARGEVIEQSDVALLENKSPGEVVNSVRQQRGLITLSEQEVLKYARAGIENQYESQAIKQIGLQGVKFNKEGIQAKIKEEFDKLIKDSDNYIMSEDSKAVDGAIQFEIDTLINDGASESQIEQAKQAFKPGSIRDSFINDYKETQKETLDQWKSYLSESDYNDSFKYLILDAVLTNNYDFKTNKYSKRTNKTLRNFTPFDAGTLAALYAIDSKSLLKDYVEIQAKNSLNVVESSSFVSTKDGEWVKFEGGPSVSNEVRIENANKLSQIVQNTYWCTKTNAKSQLDGGDFYVYATKNKDGEYESRIAVRMEGDKVGEVRGNASSKQDLEPDMMPIADKFLKENIPNNSGRKWLDSIEYNTKVKDLTERISGKKINEINLKEYFNLIKDANKFKVDYGENGLVTKLKEAFNNSEFDFPVARNLSELRPNTVLYIGDFKPSREISSDFFPKYISGDADFSNSQVTDLGNLESIGKDAYFINSQVTDLGNLESIGGDAYFSRSQITSLGNLKSIGGYAYFDDSKVTDLGGLESIGGYAYFYNSQVTDLGNLKSIGGFANFDNSQVTDLGSLESIGGYASFYNSQVTDLGNLKSIGGDASFSNSKVTSLGNLESIDGDASFSNSKVTDLGNLKSIGGFADFSKSKVTSLGNLKSISRYADFRNSQITSLGNLESIGRYAYFSDSQVTSLGNLESIGGDAYFYNSQVTDLGNLKSISGYADFRGSQITSLGNLESIGGSASFSNSKVTSLGNLESIGGFANFRNSQITSLGNLESIGRNADFRNSQITSLGNLKSIGGFADFSKSKVTSLGNLESIGGFADFSKSKVTSLGNLKSIGGSAYFIKSQVTSLGNLESIGDFADFDFDSPLRDEWENRQSAPQTRQQQAQDDFTIQDVIKDAEQGGLTRKETIEVLQELGFTKDEIRKAMKPVKKKARSVESETTGLSPKEAFKQGFIEFFDAIQRGKKEARQKAAENLKEKLNKVRESFKKRLQKEKDNKDARAAVVKEIRAIIKDSGLSRTSKRTINKIMTNVKNTNVNNMQRMVDEVMDAINRDIDREVIYARNKKLKVAKEKLSRLGALKELQNPLMEVLSINPDYLSKTALNFYDRVITNLANVEKKFDSRDSREEIKNDAKRVVEIFTNENIRAKDLAEKTVNPNLDLTKTKGENLKQMLKDGLISDSDFELMTRFEDLIGSTTKESLTLEELEQKAKERRDNAIEDFEAAMDEIPSSLPNLSKDDAEAVRFANGLKMKDLESLSTAQIKMLTRGLEMLQAGFVTTNLVQSKLLVEANRDTTENLINETEERGKVDKAISSAKVFVKNLFRKRGDMITSIENRIRSTPLANIDQILNASAKKFKSTRIFETIFRPAGVAFNKTETFLEDTKKKLQKADSFLDLNNNRKWSQKAKVMLYQIQREYESNPGNKEVNTALDYANATINDKESNLSGREKNYLQKLIDEFSVDGQIDSKKILESFTDKEKKYLAAVDDVYNSVEEMVAADAKMQGKPFVRRKNYVHLPMVTKTKNSMSDDLNEIANTFTNPALKNKALTQRTGDVHAISFDPTFNANGIANKAAISYYMYPAVKKAKITLAGVKQKAETDFQKEVADALENVFDGIVKSQYYRLSRDRAFIEKALAFLGRTGYLAQLAGPVKAAVELTTNITHAAFTNPNNLISGFNTLREVPRGVMDKALGYIPSTQGRRIVGDGVKDSKETEGRLTSDSNNLFQEEQMTSEIRAKVNTLFKFAKKPLEKIIKFNEDLIAKPDTIVARPVFVGAFNASFENIANEKPNWEKIANDQAYRDKFREAINQATADGDEAVLDNVASNNPFEGIPRNIVDRDATATKQALQMIDRYMTRFRTFEYYSALKGIQGLIGKGKLTPTQGAMLLTGTVVRLSLYKMGIDMVFSMIFSMMGIDEEDDEIEFDKDLTKGVLGAVATLALGRSFGNISQMPINYGIEWLNKEYGEDITRSGEYNQYDDGIVFSKIPMEVKPQDNMVEKIVTSSLGSYTPMVKTLTRAGKLAVRAKTLKTEEARERNFGELTTRIPFEIAGNMGLIPGYKSIRKIYNQYLFKGIEDSKTTGGTFKKSTYKPKKLKYKPKKSTREPK